MYLVPFLGLLLSIPAAWLFPLAGLIVAAISAVLAVLEGTNRPLLSKLLALDSSQNVIGLIPNRAPDEWGEVGTQRRVVLTTHLDSPRNGWVDHPSLSSLSQLLGVLTLLSILAIPLTLSVNLFVDSNIALYIAIVPALAILTALVLLTQRDVGGILDSGENNNASGIAVALAIAEELQRYPPLAVETLLVFTGARNAGSGGMTNFLAENRFNPESTYFVNLESVGRDPICFTRAEGPVLALQSSPALVHIAGDIALTNAERLMRPVIHHGMPTDQYSALIRGYQAITIMGYPEPLPGETRQETALRTEIDPAAIESAYLITHGIIRRLDDEIVASDSAQPQGTES